MSSNRSHIAKPIKIAIAYAAMLAVTAAICFHAIGQEKLLVYASESRPYSLLYNRFSSRDLLDEDNSVKILCFGDSNYIHPARRGPAGETEEPTATVPELICEEMIAMGVSPEPKLGVWAFPGADMLDYYCLYYRALALSPDLIVVIINWRSFASGWIDNPMFFHPELSAFAPMHTTLPPSYEDPVRAKGISRVKQLVYKADILSLYLLGFENWASEIRKLAIGQNMEDTDTMKLPAIRSRQTRKNRRAPANIPAVDQKEALKNSYPMTVSNSNPTFQRIRVLAHIVSKSDMKVLFYIWPLDKELLAKSGVLDEPAFEISKTMIVDAIGAEEHENIYFVDLSGLLEHAYFRDRAGHCEVEGRKKIAEALAPHISDILELTNAPDPSR